jgi:hypothetical protein
MESTFCASFWLKIASMTFGIVVFSMR